MLSTIAIQQSDEQEVENTNLLFPVFLKLEELSVLLIGGGKVALEKLNAVLGNSPATRIRLIATTISPEIKQLASQYTSINLIERPFDENDIDTADIILAAVNDRTTVIKIRAAAKQKGKLLNVADDPKLCDFYLSSIVKKGHLKIAISTNGQSPTIAKRLKEVINKMIPDEMDGVLQNMQTIRLGMQGDFDEKVKQLNDITKVLVAKQITLEGGSKRETGKWQKIVKWSILAFLIMIAGHTLLSLIPFEKLMESISTIPQQVITHSFLMMFLCGFIAQMVDGSLGMGYGTISTTFLLANGVNPAIVSSRVHSARVFSSGVSGYSHHRFGNINKKLFRALVIPGIIGAILGAGLAFYAQKYSAWVRLPLSLYTIYLGFFIIKKAFKKHTTQDKVKSAGWLASAGGFMDAFAGGGWGALVTSTLIAKRKSPRYVIGSVCLAEFFVVLASSITFFIFLKNIPLIDVAGLIFGGLIAAPVSARLIGKFPLKTTFIAVGILVILTSSTTLWRAIIQLL